MERFWEPDKKTLLPHVRERSGEALYRLENDLHRKLCPSRSTATEERVADTYIAGGGKAQWTQTPARCWINAGARRIRNKIRQIWVRIIRVVEDIEELCPELQRHPLGQQRVLEEG